ncbi:S-DNA-T family DNA segregation ATPase FtsK/SpoIIIE [Bacillus horti]|uniref:S-DNA-T family DNA segregation ATPase FtsK/SpoIIIE n=1 Tax=Caldalkalibacillus horti TaxID=77523 RepID=A0ABT9VUX3_9BACI|nr:DNA translocase FtsK [Bacillus horti]MDQ0164785.1 S-DNA-T family DNA segregation ATPase FtsK/SpoIIIE [Bacillus horti]
MTRTKKKQRQRQKVKKTLTFELYGLILLAFSILALVQPGAVGQALRGVFRFFAGSWDFLIPLAMVVLSVYVMWKRGWPTEWNFRWTGIAMLCLSILVLSHLSLFRGLTADGLFEDQSVLSATWELYKQDVNAELPETHLGGGMIGALLFSMLHFAVGNIGTIVVVVFVILISLMLLTGISYIDIFSAINKSMKKTIHWFKERRKAYKEQMALAEKERKDQEAQQTEVHVEDYETEGPSSESATSQPAKVVKGDQGVRTVPVVEGSDTIVGQQAEASSDPMIYDFTDVAYQESDQKSLNQVEQSQALATDGSAGDIPENVDISKLDAMAADVIAYEEEENYSLPPYALLHKQTRKQVSEVKGLKSTAAKLEQTIQSFGVQAKVTNVHRGPAVTRYEVYPEVGVKVSRIVSLTDDIALALAAKGIRIEAPIPGKSAVGIEVPNEDVSMVTLREVLESSQYHESSSKLTVGLGRDISGEPIVAQLNKMPHMLVAGATGSGKSVCINGIVASILYKAKPNEVKLMMIDPKMVELNVYNGIPHLLTPVVTDSKKAAIALKKVVAEMERRYDVFASIGARNIEGYNDIIRRENQENPEEKKLLLPYIVVIVDELADLMMVAPGDVEDSIGRLAQMARAAGIHLIIATQRPSVDVITGVIKANIPSRIAFGVSSMADSRTILDMGGAEKLLGRGDMLFLPVGASKPMRVQGAFVSDEEIEKIVNHCIEQQKAQYHEEMIPEDNGSSDQEAASIEDDLYQDAVDMVVNQGSASVSMLQRRFRIGYTRAARLIDSMEANGIVGPYEGSKPREVLVSKEESHIS